jgi:recombination protein RecA
MLVRSGSLDVIVIDSVAALVPKAEIDGEMSDQQTALQARLMSKALRKIVGNLSKSNTTLIFINQIRDKISTFSFGPQTTTTGGKALKFYSTIRMEVKKTGTIKNGDQIIGNETLVKVTKNKLSPPFKEATFDIIYGRGISKSGEILALALAAGVIQKNGNFYSYGEILLGQGKENAKEKLENDKDLFELIEEETIKYINK